MKTLLTVLLFIILYSEISIAQSTTPNAYFPVTNQPVQGILVDGTKTYLWGDFRYVGPNTGNGALLTTTNVLPNLAFSKVDGAIYAVVPDGSDGWYIGGSFTKVGSATRNRLARINSDGSLNAWDPNVSGPVYAIAISGSDIYVGGDFTTINGATTRNRLAKLNSTDGSRRDMESKCLNHGLCYRNQRKRYLCRRSFYKN